MALRGNLRDFSLPDVFQLVAFSRKTGVLRIVREDGESGSVWFRDGDVFFAASNWHSEPLGERMVQAQRITPQALVRALQIQQAEPDGGRRLGTILVEEGYITQAVLEVFVAEQIQDTIFDLMRWDEGEFDFDPLPDSAQQDIGLTVSMENIVMEGSRRLEEWNRIRKKIPSTDVVFKMATAPGEGSFEISLKPIEWQLLLLVDGTRSVAELAHETKKTDFDVARIIYGLFSTGLLEFASDEEVEKNRAERDRRLAAKAPAIPEPAVADVARVAEQPASGLPFLDEPAFLGGGMPSEEHSAASLEAFIGAVLEQSEDPLQAVQAAYPQVEQPAPASEPDVPVAAPPVPPQQVAPAAPQPAPEPVAQAVPQIAPQPVVPATPEPAVAPQPVVEQQSFSPQPVVEQQPVAPQLAPQPAPETSSVPVAPETVAYPSASTFDQEPVGEPDLERDLLALGLGELPARAAIPDEGHEDLSDLLQPLQPASPQPPVAQPMAPVEPDFSDLLESLYLEPQDTSTATAPTEIPPVSQEVAEPAVQAVPQPAETPAAAPNAVQMPQPETIVPSQAAVPSESVDEDLGDADFSAMPSDELTALTGAERARPRAKVNSIPEAGGGAVIQRDSRVDRETLLKIIDGIRKL